MGDEGWVPYPVEEMERRRRLYGSVGWELADFSVRREPIDPELVREGFRVIGEGERR